jgi:hypothetical protein
VRKPKKFNVESKIRSALRKIWLYSPQRREALSRAKIGGLPLWLCHTCKGSFVKEQVHVDHILACGPSKIGQFDVFIDRLFNGKLQVLCVFCHDDKSKKDNKLMR